MSSLAYVTAVLALLLSPGPTNTLMGLAGAARGLRGVFRLLPAELAGYLTTILPLVWIGAAVLERYPAASAGLKVAAAVWVMFLAVKLWGRSDEGEGGGAVTMGRIYVTTALNPKALIFALVLLPAPQDPLFAQRLALFCAMVTGVALLWGMAGALTQTGAEGTRRLVAVKRIAAVWLAVVSASLLVNVVTA